MRDLITEESLLGCGFECLDTTLRDSRRKTDKNAPATLMKAACATILKAGVDRSNASTEQRKFACEFAGPELEVRSARSEIPELPPLFQRAERVVDRHVDDPGCHQLACLSPDPLGTAAWRHWLRRTNPHFPSRSSRWSLGGSMEPPPHPGGHANSLDAAIVRASRVGA